MSIFDSKKGVLILSDCLAVMERLEDKSIDLVYLDPPWNTTSGSTFINSSNMIPDQDQSQVSEDYDEFIYKVLQQAKRLLKKNGNLILHSIPELNINFHNLLRAVFGDNNFSAEFIIPRNRTARTVNSFTHDHETVICYRVSDSSKFFPLVERSQQEIEKLFPLEENDRRFRIQPLIISSDRPALNYNWKGFDLPPGNVWRFSQQKMDSLEQEGRIYFEKDMRLPRLKVYADDNNKSIVSSIWNDITPYHKKGLYASEQSEELLNRIVRLFSEEGDIILDPFAGSGTSGVSALSNKRKWIGIEVNPEAINILKSKLEFERIDLIHNKQLLKLDVIWDSYIPFKASEIEIVIQKINEGENQRVEFKEAYIYNDSLNKKDSSIPDKIMKEVAAFLNSNYGGSIFIGVYDNGNIRGLKQDIEVVDSRKQSIDGLELAITSKIKDTFGGAVIDLINIHFYTVKKKVLCEIRVSPSEELIFLDKEFHIRNGTQALTLKPKEFYELMLTRNRKP